MNSSSSKRAKLTISESMNRKIKCCLNGDKNEHFANDAVLLTCGGNACKKCISDCLDEVLAYKCLYCKNQHLKADMLKMPPNPLVKDIIETYMSVLNEELFNEIRETSQQLKEEKLKEEIITRFDFIEYDIDARVESVVNELFKKRDELKLKLDEVKESFIKSVCNDDLRLLMKELDDTLNSEYATTYEEIVNVQNTVGKMKKMIENVWNNLNRIRFEPNLTGISRDLIGDLIIPSFRNIKSITDRSFKDAKCLTAMALIKKENQIMVLEDHRLYLMDLDDDEGVLELFEDENIEEPHALCMANDDKLFIADLAGRTKILVYDEYLNFITKFDIYGDSLCSIRVDLTDENGLLYVADTDGDQINVWNTEQVTLKKIIHIDAPDFIDFTKDYIYVTSHTAFKNDETGKLINIEEGSNCIFILNKINYEISHRIKFDNWLHPYGLIIDKYQNMITTAFELNEENVLSENRYFYVISKNREILDKIKLENDNFVINDMICVDNKIFLLLDQKIKIVEFEQFD